MSGGRLGWVPGAVIAVGSAVLAVVAPASWWGVTFAVGVLAALLGARSAVRPSYAANWTHTTVLVTLIAAVVGFAYAFEVSPWGPRRGLYLPVVTVAALAGLASVISTPGGRRVERYSSHRQNENAHGHAMRQDPR